MNETRHLGHKSATPTGVDPTMLEALPLEEGGCLFVSRFTCPEFTSLCPVTGQPDFAHIIIDYVPGAHILESKSLKLYLFGYRNHGAFHEDCTQKIANDIVAAVNPYWLRIAAFWFPRGGIPIDVFLQTGTPPDGVYVPSLEGLGYRGRG